MWHNAHFSSWHVDSMPVVRPTQCRHIRKAVRATDKRKGNLEMKKDIHPEYREVAFVDLSINKTFIIRSSAPTKETIEIDGVTYPLFKLDTSSASHPFYTGAQTRIVEAGRVEKFRAKFAAKAQAINTAAEAAKAAK